LAVAVLLRAAVTSEPISAKEYLVIVGILVLLALSKTAYTPLALLFLLIPERRFDSKMRRMAAFSAALLAAIGSALVWWRVLTAACNNVIFIEGTEPAKQLWWILQHPVDFAGLAIGFFARSAPRLATEFIGQLGWLDTPLPKPLVIGYAV